MRVRRQRCVGGDKDASEETKMRLKKWEGGILSGDVAVYRFAYALILTGFSVLCPGFGFLVLVPWFRGVKWCGVKWWGVAP